MRLPLQMAVVGVLVFGAAAFGAAEDGTDSTASRSYDLTGFEEVSVLGPHHVVISVGPAFSIRADGPPQALDDTEVIVEGGELKIRPVDDDRWERRCAARGVRGSNCANEYQTATFHITLPHLEGVALVGGGDMRVDRAEGSAFSATVAGSGDLEVAALRVDDARFTVAGSGNLVAHGSARRAHVSIAGSGNAALTAEETANISIVGSGDVDVAGPARCSVTRLGSGRVRCGGETIAS